ncbi:MAG: outer membrane protein assembly factor BamE [Gammaproteobacteria bacterium]|jgi:outer membrane protein assembly factor BamE
MRKLLTSITLFATLFLNGCSSLHVYRMNIQQGNALTEKEVQRLQTGMSKQQVRYILGDPVLEAPFHADQWHYVYYHYQGTDGKTVKRQLTVVFQNGKVSSFTTAGDFKTPLQAGSS